MNHLSMKSCWKNIMMSIVFLMSIMHFNLAMGNALPANTAKIADGVYSFGGVVPYYSMFIVTEEGVLVIEPVNTNHSLMMLQAIREITDKPIKYLFHSHNHWDHSKGGKVFQDAGAKIVAHKEAYDWMVANPHEDMSTPDEYWEGSKKVVQLGGMTLELHYLGMNHGLGNTIFLLPDEKVAYMADIVTPKRVLFSIVPDFNIKEWERSLNEILEMDFERAIFSHSNAVNPILGGTKTDIKENLQFIQDLRSAVRSEFVNGTDPMMIPGIVSLPKYSDWAMYNEWLTMNAWRIMLDDWMGPFPWRPNK